MAKDNLFLGVARGSIGSVTFYTKNGQQISRVRTRSVRNPNTDGQLYQRAILATVAKAYQAGSVIFDHSFEGVEAGANSQARFMKENIKILRQLVANDVNNNHGDGECKAAVVPRNSVWPVANIYRVSTGSLVQDFFNIEIVSEGNFSEFSISVKQPSAGQTVGQWLSENGIVDDDIFTVVAFGVTDSSWDFTNIARFYTVYESGFGFVRFRVRTSAIDSASPAVDATLQSVFDIESSGGSLGNISIDDSFGISDIVRNAVTGAVGVIRSRENSGLRSTCDMVIATTGAQWGIISKYITEQWDPTAASLGTSPLILEGGRI